MKLPDFERAKQYALERLEHELSPTLVYHGLTHTRDDVVPAAERLAAMVNLNSEALLLLRTAAYYHDMGFVEQYTDNEAIAVRITSEVLPGMGYSPEQIQIIGGIIMTTQLPQTPHTPLEEMMADADLDLLGRDDFWPLNAALRAERSQYIGPVSDCEWYSSQLKFLRAHHYFTPGARAMREAAKQRYIAEMAARLEQCRTIVPPLKEFHMPPSDERVAILRSVGIFAETPDPILAEVAVLLQPVELQAGETIFDKGDCGDCMYIIVNGRVRVHDGELFLNHLGVADVFGEMAVLDAQPRLASVTAAETTRLFRLDQASFYELMNKRPEVARGIIRVLNRHLRGRVRDMAHDFEYMQQMARISAAAAALEAGHYDPRGLDEVGQRPDELGQLARVFRRMADEVVAREQRLKQQVQELRIQIDEAKKEREVAQITESDYFQSLQQKVKKMRKR